MRRILFIGFSLFVAAVLGSAFYLFVLPNVRSASAVLRVEAGSATLFSEGGRRDVLQPQRESTVRPQDRIRFEGQGSLLLARAQLDVTQTASLTLQRHHWLPLNGWQISVLLENGQAAGRITSVPEPLAFTLYGPSGYITFRDQASFVASTLPDGTMQIGLIAGTAIVRSLENENESAQLRAGQGIRITPGQRLPAAIPWSSFRALVYDANGSPLVLPVTLSDPVNGNVYHFRSGESTLVPNGTYTLSLDTLGVYRIENVTIGTGEAAVNELAVTLSRVTFRLLNPDGSEVRNVDLLVHSEPDQAPYGTRTEQPLTVGPGTWRFAVARADAPDLLQIAAVNIAPGESTAVELRSNLFGGAAPQVTVLGLDGQSVRGTTVRIFRADQETGNGIATFATGGEPPLLPEGRYVISVQTQLVARYEVEIRRGRPSTPITVRQGRLQVNYTNERGSTRPPRDVIILSTREMVRLNLNENTMPTAPVARPYRLGVQSGSILTLPVGEYIVIVDDRQDVIERGVLVRDGETTTLDLKAQP